MQNSTDNVYIIDTKKLFEVVSSSYKQSSKDNEITTGYEKNSEGVMEPTSKVLREVTSRGDTFIDNLKYDFIKSMIMICVEGMGEGAENMDDGDLLCFNTLVNDGIIIRKKVKK